MLVPCQIKDSYKLVDVLEGEGFNSRIELAQELVKRDKNVSELILQHISFLNSLLGDIGGLLPPLTKEDLVPSGGIRDRVFSNELSNWISNTFRDWDLEDRVHEIEEWYLVPLSRFSYTSVSVGEEDYWCLVDSEEEEGEGYIDFYELSRLMNSYSIDEPLPKQVEGSVLGVLESEQGAEELVDLLNTTLTEPSCGYPFAWNTYWELPSYIPIELAQEAGFVVYESSTEAKTFMGIDGGGYDFMSQHWAPLYLNYCASRGLMVSTTKGERRVV